MSIPFRERNPVIIGAISLAVIALLILAAFKADDLPLIGGGDTYYAAFTEAGGLKANDEVRIAGVRVGKVEAVELDGDHVKVDLPGRRRGADFGTRDRRRDQGQDPARRDVPRPRAGRAPASSTEGARSRSSRTTSPYDVVQAFSGLADPPSRSTPTSCAKSLTTLADLTRNTPEEFQGAAAGRLGALGQPRARDEQINTLLQNLTARLRRSSTTATRTSSG